MLVNHTKTIEIYTVMYMYKFSSHKQKYQIEKQNIMCKQLAFS